MISIGDAMNSAMGEISSATHIEGNPGDYIGPDNRLHCAVCGDTKEFYIAPLGRFVPSLCRCGRAERNEVESGLRKSQEMHRVEELAAYSLMDKAMAKARFEIAEINADNKAAYDAAQHYVKSFDDICKRDITMKGLMFYGPPGTGKSYIAACIANALMAQRVPVMYTSVIKMTSADPERVREVIEKMNRAKLLVLDDLGAERGTEFKLEQVFNIVDTRLNSRKPLIVTTNYTLKQMTDTGDMRYLRIWERVRSMCYPVKMEGTSWRSEKNTDAIEIFKQMIGQ